MKHSSWFMVQYYFCWREFCNIRIYFYVRGGECTPKNWSTKRAPPRTPHAICLLLALPCTLYNTRTSTLRLAQFGTKRVESRIYRIYKAQGKSKVYSISHIY